MDTETITPGPLAALSTIDPELLRALISVEGRKELRDELARQIEHHEDRVAWHVGERDRLQAALASLTPVELVETQVIEAVDEPEIASAPAGPIIATGDPTERLMLKGPYRRRREIVTALHAIGGGITPTSLATAWGIVTGAAGLLLARLFAEGVLVVDRLPSNNGEVSYGVRGVATDALAALPKGSIPWDQMPTWVKSERHTVQERCAAYQQAAVLARIEARGDVVAIEIAKDLDIPKLRAKSYAKALHDAGLVKRGKQRREHGQVFGRYAESYQPLSSRLDAPTDEAIRDEVVELGEFTAASLAQHFDLDVSEMHRRLKPMVDRGRLRRVGGDYQLRELPPAPKMRPTTSTPGRTPASEVAGNGRPTSTNKDLDRLLARAHAAGWRMEKRGGGHIMVFPSHGRAFPVSNTPSDRNAVHQARRQFERAGLR